MSRYIALLRGINVGGHKKILMADLRSLLSSGGLANVTTYIQSGNVLFESALKASQSSDVISKKIQKKYGWEVPVLVKTASEITQILEACPFSEEIKLKSYFILFDRNASEENIKEINLEDYPNEEIFISTNCAYIFCESGYHNAKCGTNYFEKKLHIKATARNYRTMAKLVEMAT